MRVGSWALTNSKGFGRRSARDSARLGPTVLQYGSAVCATAALAGALRFSAHGVVAWLHVAFYVLFAGNSLLTLGLVWLARTAPRVDAPAVPDAELPTYTVIAALYDEAAMIPGLLNGLARLDYPRERLQVILALEADDVATRRAVAAAAGLLATEVVLSPAAGPRTKPKACNEALRAATGEFVTIYDAEDRPDPGQLREAVARFRAGDPRLGCLQAPLRIAGATGWLQRQFALEYAALFEVKLPAYARLGLAFPLGGTSNHFRRAALAEAGGWDPWNVTEDADMGLRLAALGWRLGVLSRPTWESAPPTLAVWTPQRTRWIKGHMQTWGVHMRRPGAGGWRRVAGLQLTLGIAILSCVLHGAIAAGMAATVLVSVIAWRWPGVGWPDIALFAGGWASAVVAVAQGERRRGGRLRVGEALGALAYWPLQSLAAMNAVTELVVDPFAWSKTPHKPVPAVEEASARGA